VFGFNFVSENASATKIRTPIKLVKLEAAFTEVATFA